MNRIVFALGLALTSALTLFTPALSAAPAPEAWEIWDKADNSSEAVIDHSLWQAVLDSHLKPSADGINRFAYKALAAEGAAILIISSDLEEILRISDRVLVLHEGKLAGELSRDDLNEESVMQLATGGTE